MVDYFLHQVHEACVASGIVRAVARNWAMSSRILSCPCLLSTRGVVRWHRGAQRRIEDLFFKSRMNLRSRTREFDVVVQGLLTVATRASTTA
jgi:hypothetical protein